MGPKTSVASSRSSATIRGAKFKTRKLVQRLFRRGKNLKRVSGRMISKPVKVQSFDINNYQEFRSTTPLRSISRATFRSCPSFRGLKDLNRLSTHSTDAKSPGYKRYTLHAPSPSPLPRRFSLSDGALLGDDLQAVTSSLSVRDGGVSHALDVLNGTNEAHLPAESYTEFLDKTFRRESAAPGQASPVSETGLSYFDETDSALGSPTSLISEGEIMESVTYLRPVSGVQVVDIRARSATTIPSIEISGSGVPQAQARLLQYIIPLPGIRLDVDDSSVSDTLVVPETIIRVPRRRPVSAVADLNQPVPSPLPSALVPGRNSMFLLRSKPIAKALAKSTNNPSSVAQSKLRHDVVPYITLTTFEPYRKTASEVRPAAERASSEPVGKGKAELAHELNLGTPVVTGAERSPLPLTPMFDKEPELDLHAKRLSRLEAELGFQTDHTGWLSLDREVDKHRVPAAPRKRLPSAAAKVRSSTTAAEARPHVHVRNTSDGGFVVRSITNAGARVPGRIVLAEGAYPLHTRYANPVAKQSSKQRNVMPANKHESQTARSKPAKHYASPLRFAHAAPEHAASVPEERKSVRASIHDFFKPTAMLDTPQGKLARDRDEKNKADAKRILNEVQEFFA